jgi:hypothetical protein
MASLVTLVQIMMARSSLVTTGVKLASSGSSQKENLPPILLLVVSVSYMLVASSPSISSLRNMQHARHQPHHGFGAIQIIRYSIHYGGRNGSGSRQTPTHSDPPSESPHISIRLTSQLHPPSYPLNGGRLLSSE